MAVPSAIRGSGQQIPSVLGYDEEAPMWIFTVSKHHEVARQVYWAEVSLITFSGLVARSEQSERSGCIKRPKKLMLLPRSWQDLGDDHPKKACMPPHYLSFTPGPLHAVRSRLDNFFVFFSLVWV